MYKEKECKVCKRKTVHNPKGECLDCKEREAERKGWRKPNKGIKVEW